VQLLSFLSEALVRLMSLPRTSPEVEKLTRKRLIYRARTEASPAWLLFKSAQGRAKKHGLPFNLTLEAVQALVPSDQRCPITGALFERSGGKVGPRSPSLDRVVPELGYVLGNVKVISYLANTMKQDCTDPDVLRRLAAYVRGDLCVAKP
jgi:hypothetical protein